MPTGVRAARKRSRAAPVGQVPGNRPGEGVQMRKADALPDALSDLSNLPETDPTGSYNTGRGPRPSASYETVNGIMTRIDDPTATEDDCGTWDPINGLRSRADIRRGALEILEERRREESRMLERQRSRQPSLAHGRSRIPTATTPQDRPLENPDPAAQPQMD